MKHAFVLFVLLLAALPARAQPLFGRTGDATMRNLTVQGLQTTASSNVQNAFGSSIVRFRPTEVTTGDPYSNPDSTIFGGVDLGNSTGFASSGSVEIRGAPYGAIDAGTLFSAVMTNNSIYGSRAGISTTLTYGQLVPALATNSGMDVGVEFDEAQNLNSKLVLHNATYDKTHIYPANPLTPDQIKLLRRTMYVSTNSVDPTIPASTCADATFCDFRHLQTYGAIVTGWASDGTSIAVEGWTVPGGGNTNAGQNPQGKSLDTVYSQYSNQTAFIGDPLKAFNHNWVMNWTPGLDSNVHSLEGLELDEAYGGLTDGLASIHGMTLTYNASAIAADGHHPTPTTDSYQIHLAGNMPHQLILDPGFIDTLRADAFRLYNAKGVAQYVGATNEMAEFINNADTNTDSVKTYLKLDTLDGPSASGWQTRSWHQQMFVDVAAGTANPNAGMGDLVYNPPGYRSGVGLSAGNHLGVVLDASGNVTIPTKVTILGTTTIGGYTVAALPSGCGPGQLDYATDGRKAGEAAGAGSGVPVICTPGSKSGTPAWYSLFTGTPVVN